MSEDEIYEEEAEAIEEEAPYELEEAEEVRREELPLDELERMTDILVLMRKALRGEIEEEEYRKMISEMLALKPTPGEERKGRKEERTRRKSTKGKKAA